MVRPSPVRPGFTAWVDNLARQHTDALVAAAVEGGLASDEALDSVQESFTTFLTLPHARTLAEHREDCGALLSILVRNAARNVRRRHLRPRPAPPADEPSILDDSPSVATLVAAAEQHIVMLGCADKLAEIQRAVVRLRVLEEIGSGAAAAQLGLSAGRVAGLLHRAKAALQLCMVE
ncbi:MAG TPA: sigma factor-like helix-turn-helix DNA-binding protein [Kofleriaceae bacterium]|nr:sigma factor-like helix-turn-helix DNA-binding protein [Kofleriaceae bacterium]